MDMNQRYRPMGEEDGERPPDENAGECGAYVVAGWGPFDENAGELRPDS